MKTNLFCFCSIGRLVDHRHDVLPVAGVRHPDRQNRSANNDIHRWRPGDQRHVAIGHIPRSNQRAVHHLRHNVRLWCCSGVHTDARHSGPLLQELPGHCQRFCHIGLEHIYRLAADAAEIRTGHVRLPNELLHAGPVLVHRDFVCFGVQTTVATAATHQAQTRPIIRRCADKIAGQRRQLEEEAVRDLGTFHSGGANWLLRALRAYGQIRYRQISRC